jgi:hypothetical protein
MSIKNIFCLGLCSLLFFNYEALASRPMQANVVSWFDSLRVINLKAMLRDNEDPAILLKSRIDRIKNSGWWELQVDRSRFLYLAKTNLSSANEIAKVLLPKISGVENPGIILLRQDIALVLAMGGDSSTLDLKQQKSPELVLWAQAIGKNFQYAPGYSALIESTKGTDFCRISRLANPFLLDDSPVKKQITEFIASRLVDSDNLVSNCAADALINNWNVLSSSSKQTVFNLVKKYLNTVQQQEIPKITKLLVFFLAKQEFSYKLAQLVASKSLTSPSEHVRKELRNVLIDSLHVVDMPAKHDNNNEVQVSGYDYNEISTYLATTHHRTDWKLYLIDLSYNQRRLLIEEFNNKNSTDLLLKLRDLTESNFFDLSPNLLKLLPERAYIQQQKHLYFSSAIQRTVLGIQFKASVTPQSQSNDWRDALKEPDPALKYYVLRNAATSCSIQTPREIRYFESEKLINYEISLLEKSLSGCLSKVTSQK